MSNDVFANGREISCKKADGKSIASFPDVCFTPPTAPPTPPGVPIPYPNTAFAKDTTKGSKTVKITGNEVIMKNKSYFKTSTGDEAGNTPKKGLMTSKIKGKAYFTAWSMDVKVQSKNVCRHFDMTTHNHNTPPNTGPWMYADTMAYGNPPECKADTERMQTACESSKSKKVGSRKQHVSCSKECKEAMQCILVPKGLDKELCCSPNNTGHHMIEDHWIENDGKLMPGFSHLAGKSVTISANADLGRKRAKSALGSYDAAPTVCVNKSRYTGKHGIFHGTQGVREEELIGKNFNYGKAKEIALEAHGDAFPNAPCSDGCLEAQLDSFYGKGKNKKCTPPSKQSMKPHQRSRAEGRVTRRNNDDAGY